MKFKTLINCAVLAAVFIACGCFVHGESAAEEDAPRVTGHRMVRAERDFDLYVIREPLPTLLLIYSSKEEDCDPKLASCLELYEDIKKAAMETKGYVRFATADISDPDTANVVKNALRMTEKPPILLAFSDSSQNSGGRSAMRLNTQFRPPVSQLKKIASDLLPSNVHRSKSLQDFEKVLNDAKTNNVPLVAVLAPKLSEKPTAMLKASWAMIKENSNFTTIDYSLPEAKAIIEKIGDVAVEAIAKGETIVVGTDSEGKFRKSVDREVTPDTISELVRTIGLTFRKKGSSSSSSSAKQKKLPPGVYSNFTEDDFERLVMRPNTATIIGLRSPQAANELSPPNDVQTNMSWPEMATQFISQFGGHSAIIYCDHPGSLPKLCTQTQFDQEEWKYFVATHQSAQAPRKTLPVKSLKEALDTASASVLTVESQGDDVLEVVEGASASDFIQLSMAHWSNPSMRSTSRVPLVFLGVDEEPPAFVRAAHATMRGLAKIVYVKPGYKEDVLKALHLEPGTVFPPSLVAYVPSFEDIPEDDEPQQQKKKGKKNAPPKQSKFAYRVVPYESQRQAFGPLQYESAVIFIQDLFRYVDVERWEKFIEEVFPITAPPALSNPILQRLGKTRVTDSTKIPPAGFISNTEEMNRVCGSNLCVLVFAERRNDEKRMEVVEATRKIIEKTPFGMGIRFGVIDGSCHSGVVDALGGDPTMLPVVAVYSPAKKGASLMRGVFSSENIQTLVRNVKKGAVPIINVSKNPSEVFTDESVCYSTTDDGNSAGSDGNNDDDDEMLRQIREEAVQEQLQKELARKNAEMEAKRLKEERDAELKKQRENLHKIAEEERMKRKKIQQELDEQRLREREAKLKNKQEL